MTTVDFRTVGTRYHQQDKPASCGEAVAEMILRSLRVTNLDQDALETQLQKTKDGTTPTDLCGLLNNNLPAAERGFVVLSDPSPEEGMRRIFSALARPRSADDAVTAVPAFVVGQSHWVAVTGVAFDSSNGLQTAEILGFFIHNPEPQRPHPPVPALGHLGPPPHSEEDTCGLLVPTSGGIYGNSNTFVTTFEWLHYYWRNEDKRPAFVTIAREGAANLPLSGTVRPVAPVANPSSGPFDFQKVSDAVNAGVARFNLSGAGSPLARVLATARAGPHDVVSVDRIPTNTAAPIGTSERYHLVHLRQDGAIVGNVRIGADDDQFLSLQAAPSPAVAQWELHDFASGVLERFRSDTFAIDRSVVLDRRFTVHPNLVWRPCLQSMSHFYPFVQINLAGTIVFASLDGRLHRALDDHPVP